MTRFGSEVDRRQFGRGLGTDLDGLDVSEVRPWFCPRSNSQKTPALSLTKKECGALLGTGDGSLSSLREYYRSCR